MPRQSFLSQCLCTLLALALFFSPCFVPGRAAAWGEFTIKDERELGDKFNVLIRSRLPLVQDPEVTGYVEDMVKRLSRAMPPQPFPFTVGIIQHNALNAFATPGGYIFVHTGLIMGMKNESELAGVIAHEMAHVTQRHIARRIESSRLISILSVLGALAGAFLGGEGGAAALTGSLAAGQATMLNYSREDEREADQVGMNYLTKAGYSVTGMAGAFEVLNRKQWLLGGDIPSYLSTHPGLSERIRDMNVRVSRLPAARQAQKDDNTRFLRIQALVRGRYGDPQPTERVFAGQMDGPHRCVALMGQGILTARQNRVNDAAAFFDKALACSPDDQLIVREAGCFHYTKGNKHKAAGLLDKAVAMNRNDSVALFYRARSLADLGKTGEAVNQAQQVLRKIPDDPETHRLLAGLYGSDGKLFLANLHMAYSGLFENDERRVRQFLEKARPLALTDKEKGDLKRFEQLYADRRQFWKKK